MDPTTRPTHAELSHPPLPSSTPQLELTIGKGLPPVPGKLITKIESGQFIESAELQPDRLGITAASDNDGSKSKNNPITSITEWIQCFGIYTTVLLMFQLRRVADLLDYQTLILQSYMEFRGDHWLGYDCTFRLKAATQKKISSGLPWTQPYGLWTFLTQGADRCQHCFSLHHTSSKCSWNTDFKPAAVKQPLSPTLPRESGAPLPFASIGIRTHHQPVPSRTANLHTNCIKNPKATDTAHKVLYCPYCSDHHLNTAPDR